jgi:hypothetical protein
MEITFVVGCGRDRERDRERECVCVLCVDQCHFLPPPTDALTSYINMRPLLSFAPPPPFLSSFLFFLFSCFSFCLLAPNIIIIIFLIAFYSFTFHSDPHTLHSPLFSPLFPTLIKHPQLSPSLITNIQQLSTLDSFHSQPPSPHSHTPFLAFLLRPHFLSCTIPHGAPT